MCKRKFIYIAIGVTLFSVVATTLAIFYLRLYYSHESPTESNPCILDFQPKPQESNSESSRIWHKKDDPKDIKYFKNQLDMFLEPYTKLNQDTDPIYIDCPQGVPPMEGSGKVCRMNIDRWYPCTSIMGYALNSTVRGFCVFLKLSKMSGWVPEYYNTSTIPPDMPRFLKNYIRKTEAEVGANSDMLKVVWMSCEGKNQPDVEHIGPVMYLPQYGFDGRYFPVINDDGYLSPLVALHFENPTSGVVINIECKTWARNINSLKGVGTVHFELLID